VLATIAPAGKWHAASCSRNRSCPPFSIPWAEKKFRNWRDISRGTGTESIEGRHDDAVHGIAIAPNPNRVPYLVVRVREGDKEMKKYYKVISAVALVIILLPAVAFLEGLWMIHV